MGVSRRPHRGPHPQHRRVARVARVGVTLLAPQAVDDVGRPGGARSLRYLDLESSEEASLRFQSGSMGSTDWVLGDLGMAGICWNEGEVK